MVGSPAAVTRSGRAAAPADAPAAGHGQGRGQGHTSGAIGKGAHSSHAPQESDLFNVSAATVASVQAQQEHRDQYEHRDQGKGNGIDLGEGTSVRPSSSSRFPRSPRD